MTWGEEARAGRSYEGEARSATVKLAMNTETKTACDGEQWSEERGREAEETPWLVAACTELL